VSGRILIVGAGPAGLGAAWRLQELGCSDWLLLESAERPGGLAASFVDPQGFTWDIGGHIVFSHYPYFDAVLDSLFGPHEWARRERQSWIRMRGGFIPYPFQHNLWRLPKEELADCLCGLVRARLRPSGKPSDFREWILARFGEGIAHSFLLPYNWKVWAYPAETLSCGWVAERVAEADLERVVRNVCLERDDPGWGSNNRFRYPLCGGIGEIWRRCARRLPPERLRFGEEVKQVDAGARVVRTAGGGEYRYAALISTMPLTSLCAAAGVAAWADEARRGLLATGTHAVGIGLEGAPAPEIAEKDWIYFPEDDCPFYRATVFGNYSSHNLPDRGRYWSLLAETSESPDRPVDSSRIVDETIKGLLNTGMIGDAARVVSTWRYHAPAGYPAPGRERDVALARLMPGLESRDIFSRGRFGAWRYEVSNQDHSFMQGVEVVDRLLLGKAETTLYPAVQAEDQSGGSEGS
jgi:protoporphyrinogen oxidase